MRIRHDLIQIRSTDIQSSSRSSQKDQQTDIFLILSLYILAVKNISFHFKLNFYIVQ